MSLTASVSQFLQPFAFSGTQPARRPQVREEYCPFCKEKRPHTLLEEVTPSEHLAGPAGLLLLCNTCQACSLH